MSFIHQIDPVAFYVFNWPVKWYALSYLFSFCYAFFVFSKSNLVKDQILQQKLDILIDIFWGIILGGRLGYVLLYDPLYYLFSPLKIFFCTMSSKVDLLISLGPSSMIVFIKELVFRSFLIFLMSFSIPGFL